MLTCKEAPDHGKHNPEGEVGLGEDPSGQCQQGPDDEDHHRQAARPYPGHLVCISHLGWVFFLAVNYLRHTLAANDTSS